MISALAVTVAAISVVFGVNAWRREFVGKRRIELVEDMLAAFYEAEDAIRHIRNPAGFTGEGKTRERGPGESEQESKVRDNAYVVIERYQHHNEQFAQLRSLKYRAMATFGEEAKEPFDEIARVLNQIFFAAHMLGSHFWQHAEWEAAREVGQREKHNQSVQKYEAIFWQAGDDDEIGRRVHSAVEAIEQIAADANNQKPTLAQRFGL